MKKKEIKLKEQVRIPIVGEDVCPDETIDVTENDMKKMRGVLPLYRAYKDALGGRLGIPRLAGNVLCIDILPDESAVDYSMKDFVSDLRVTHQQLCANANSDQPLPHGVAIRKPYQVGLLKAVHAAHANYGLVGSVVTSDGPEEVPLPQATDFTQPDAGNENQQTGSFAVFGLRRDDRRGHRLIVTDNDLSVLLPTEDADWSWPKIHHVLEQPTLLVGTLTRESKSHPWVPMPGAKLVCQDSIEGFA